eukprot:jgi/Botrbrau1/919/Bobra.0167s0033.2
MQSQEESCQEWSHGLGSSESDSQPSPVDSDSLMAVDLPLEGSEILPPWNEPTEWSLTKKEFLERAYVTVEACEAPSLRRVKGPETVHGFNCPLFRCWPNKDEWKSLTTDLDGREIPQPMFICAIKGRQQKKVAGSVRKPNFVGPKGSTQLGVDGVPPGTILLKSYECLKKGIPPMRISDRTYKVTRFAIAQNSSACNKPAIVSTYGLFVVEEKPEVIVPLGSAAEGPPDPELCLPQRPFQKLKQTMFERCETQRKKKRFLEAVASANLKRVKELAADMHCQHNKRFNEISDGYGRRPLHLAVQRKPRILDDPEKKMPTSDVCNRSREEEIKDRLDLIEFLLNKSSRNEKRKYLAAVDRDNCTCLHMAAQHGDPRLIRALLDNGASNFINMTSKSGWLAIHVAANEEHQLALEMLLTHESTYNVPADVKAMVCCGPGCKYYHGDCFLKQVVEGLQRKGWNLNIDPEFW